MIAAREVKLKNQKIKKLWQLGSNDCSAVQRL
jgi:hypothetical protein